MAELVDAADSKSVFERSGSSSLPRGTKIRKKPTLWSVFLCLAFPPDRATGQLTACSASAGTTGINPCLHLIQAQPVTGAVVQRQNIQFAAQQWRKLHFLCFRQIQPSHHLIRSQTLAHHGIDCFVQQLSIAQTNRVRPPNASSITPYLQLNAAQCSSIQPSSLNLINQPAF